MLGEFVRTAWVSDEAKAVWQPRVTRIAAAFQAVELESVEVGLRAAALVFGQPTGRALVYGEVAPGRYAVARSVAAVAELQAAYGKDDMAVGALLGFPRCCRTFFDRVWNVEKKRDTTLSMIGNDQHMLGPNILGRWLGVRCVPHLPCRWDCHPTQYLADRFDELWPDQERQWRNEILGWPVEYSALHGIAIITTPVYKIVTDTDYTATGVVLQRQGLTYPAEGARGLKFPFTVPAKLVQIGGLQSDPRLWTDNGFPTKAAMEANHAMLLNALGSVLDYRQHAEVIDFGSGNGRLLEKIQQRWGAEVFGVESDGDRFSRSRVPAKLARIEDLPERLTRTFGVGLISARRLEEMDGPTEEIFLRWAKAFVGDLVVYSYDEPRFVRFE